MMEWKTLGVAMIIPTVFVAALLAWHTWDEEEFLVNLAILAWILSNAFWMLCEFFGYLQYKELAALGFATGAISISVFYFRRFKSKKVVQAVS